MIKYFLPLILIVFSTLLMAQEQQKQDSDVELPDFVITGKDVVTVQKSQKIPPGIISVVSEQFVKPALPPENLSVTEISIPVKGASDLGDSLDYLKGKLDAEVGIYYLPRADLEITNPFNNGLFEVFGNAESQREYIIGRGKYHLTGGTNLMLYAGDNSGFVSGTELKFHGDFSNYGYKLYASDDPLFQRSYNRGEVSVAINNTLNKQFILSAKVNDKISSFQKEDFSENLFGFLGAAKFTASLFNLGLNADFQKQFVKNNFYDNGKFNYTSLTPSAGMEFPKFFKFNIGLNYTKTDSIQSTTPYFAAGFYLNDRISIFGEYNQKPEFLTAGHYAEINPYFRAQNFSNILIKKNTAFNVTFKYTYLTYYEIDGGIKYVSFDNLPYFSDAVSRGIFDILTTRGKSISGFINLLFHLGPYGVFYGTAEEKDVRDSSNNFIPYYPASKLTLNYGYNFGNGLSTEASLIYFSKCYTDIQNTRYLNPYIDLGIKLIYELNTGFDFTLKMENLLNNSNYYWNGYKELPFNISAGVSINW